MTIGRAELSAAAAAVPVVQDMAVVVAPSSNDGQHELQPLTDAQKNALAATAQHLVARGKGILAADESTRTVRFDFDKLTGNGLRPTLCARQPQAHYFVCTLLLLYSVALVCSPDYRVMSLELYTPTLSFSVASPAATGDNTRRRVSVGVPFCSGAVILNSAYCLYCCLCSCAYIASCTCTATCPSTPQPCTLYYSA